MSSPLRVVPPAPTARGATSPANLGQRVRQLQAEARRLAHEHVDALNATLAQVRLLAEDVANGGEAYPPGVRDIARRLAEDSAARAQALDSILARS